MRIRLSDLTPGINYSLQVRATDGARVSDWSRVFSLLTSSDTIAPKTPTSVVGSMTGTSFNLSWAAVTQSSDNSSAMDLDRYRVLVSSAGTGTTKMYDTTDTKFQFTFEMNRELFGTARANIVMSVCAIDKTGNASAFSAAVDQTNAAPANVTGLSGIASVDTVTLKWTANTDADLAGYQVWRSKTGAAGTYTLQWSGTGTQWADPTTDYFTDHWYRVYAVDVFGTLSATPAQTGAALRPVGSFTLDTVAPDVPTGLAAVLTTLADYSGASMAVSWTAVADPTGDLSGYRIGYRPVGASDWQYTDVDNGAGTATSTLIDKLTALVNYEVRIRSYDFQGNYSNWSSTVTTSTAATNVAPSTPTAPSVSSSTQNIQVSIPGTKAAGGAMEGDVTLYEVYASTTTGFTPAAANQIGLIPVSPAMIATFQIPTSGTGTTQTWYVKIIAVDKGGLKSPASAQATSTPGLILNANIADATITSAKIASLAADKITAGTGLIADLTVKSTLTLGDASNDGIIKSYDWVSNTTGYRMTKNTLEINGGVIKAAALQLQNGHNIMPPAYADFEYTDFYYISSFWNSRGQGNCYISGANSLVDISISSKVFGTQALKIANLTGTAAITARLAPNNTTYNIVVEPSEKYIVSFYARNDGPAATWSFSSIGNNAASLGTVNVVGTAAEANYTRYQFIATIPASAVSSMVVEITSSTSVTKSIHIDGFQIEKVEAGLQVASAWKPPGQTVIDGSGVTTGYLRSTADIAVAGTLLPAWSINKTGSMQIGDALVRGKLIVGTTGESTPNIAPNGGDFETNVTGYQVFQLGATGTAIARTTTGGEVIEGTGSAKVTAAAGAKSRLGISFAPAYPLPGGTVVRASATVKVNTTDAGSTLRVVFWNPAVTAFHIADLVTDPVAGQQYELTYDYVIDDTETATLVSFSHAGTLTTTSFIADNVVLLDRTVVGASYVSSPDYTQGDAGWRISGDGTVEFNNGIFRGTLGANMVTGETLSGNIVLASTFLAGDIASRHVEFSPAGIQLWDIDGTQMVNLPTDAALPASFSGDLLASSLTISDQLAIRGTTNELAKGSTLTIQSGTTAPNSPPTVSVGWEQITKTDPINASYDPYKYGFAYDSTFSGGCFLTVQNVYGGNASIARISKTTGNNLPWVGILLSRIRSGVGGVTVVGSNAYVLGTDINGDWYIEGRSLSTGAKVLDVPYVNLTSKYTPTIGNDGTNLLIGFIRTADRKATMQGINITTGANLGAVTTNTAFGGGNDALSFIGKSTYDYGVTRYVIGRRTYNYMYTFDSTGVQPVGSNYEAFPSAGDITGAVYADIDGNGSVFWTYDALAGKITRHSTLKYTGSAAIDSTYWVANTWYDSSLAPEVTFTVTNKALTSNVATLTTSAPHGLTTGMVVVVAGVDATFNGTYTLTAGSGSTLSYAKTASNVTSTAATGTVGEQSTTHETEMGPPKAFTVARRQSIVVTVPPLPIRPLPNTGNDAVAARVYMAKGTALPTFTKMDRQSTLPDGVRVGYYGYSYGTAVSVPAATFDAAGGEQPPNSNGFSTLPSAAALIKSSNNQFNVNGLGQGAWGAMTVTSTGAIVIPNQLPVATASGSVSIAALVVNASTGSTAVSFPVGRFTVAPKVFMTTTGGRLNTAITSVTTSGFNYIAENYSNANAGAATGTWFAIQD